MTMINNGLKGTLAISKKMNKIGKVKWFNVAVLVLFAGCIWEITIKEYNNESYMVNGNIGTGIIGTGIGITIEEYSNVSNSAKWLNQRTRDIISQYSDRYDCDFEVATKDIEKRLYGVWRIKEFVGRTATDRNSFDGAIGYLIIFCEEAWIDYWNIPSYKPVCFYHETSTEELFSESFLNISWVDNRYSNQENGIYAVVINAEKTGEHKATLQLIIFDDALVLREDDSYFELEKIAEIDMQDNFSNPQKVQGGL